jgi:hypothetical protein
MGAAGGREPVVEAEAPDGGRFAAAVAAVDRFGVWVLLRFPISVNSFNSERFCAIRF